MRIEMQSILIVMCTNTKTIYSRRRFVNPNYMDVFQKVPCGCCVCCQQQKQTEYALRSYYEYLETKHKGGMTYWDTLTYRNEDIPTHFGYYCFNRKDVQDFFKRLRKRLADDFGITNKALRYLVTSEYGDDRHRVHYHVVYFLHVPFDVDTFQKVLNETWTKGHCGNQKMLEDGKIRSLSERVVKSQAALNYVTKYIAKDDEFTKKNVERVIASVCSNNVFPPSCFALHHDFKSGFSHITFNPLDKTRYKDVYYEKDGKRVKMYNPKHYLFPDLRRCSLDDCDNRLNNRVIERYFKPFHLQSVGFGSYLLENPTIDVDDSDALNVDDETAFLPTDTNVKKAIDLPLYYRRKLFYHTVDIDGRLMWFPNDEYKDKLYFKELQAIDNDEIQLKNRINSLDALVKIPSIYENVDLSRFVSIAPDELQPTSLCEFCMSVLGSRSVRDLAIYQRYYRGRYSRDFESVYDVISRRLERGLSTFPFGCIENPLQVDDVDTRRLNRRKFRSVACSDIDDVAFSGFDGILDLIDSIFSAYSSFSVIRELDLRKQKKKMKAYKNIHF